MKKKIFAVAMATTMVLSSAMTAAAEDIDATGWWVAHSKSYEVDADGLTLNFKATTYADATNNWNTPIYVVYTATEAFAGGEGISNTPGYAEAFVMRADNYGWAGANNTGAALQGLLDAGFVVNEGAGVPADDAGWAAWLEGCKAGTDCTLKATKGDGKIDVAYTVNGLTSNMTIPVDTTKPVYISLSGELCKLTGIAEAAGETTTTAAGETTTTAAAGETTTTAAAGEKTTTKKATTPATGDVAPVVTLAAMAVLASAAVVVSRKKVTE